MSAKDVIIVLDFPTREETLSFLDRFPAGEKPFVKIGMELFYAEGPQVVRDIKARGHKIFLDLKLHDIPNTVKRAMAVLSRLDIDMVNLHAAGTAEMMRAALEGLPRPDGTRPLLIAVTQLTSTDAAALKNELLIDTPMAETVLSYAKNAAASGLDGVVCSPLEAALVKERCGADFLTVTPGIRFADSAAGDDAGAFRRGLQQNGAGAEDADDLMGDGGAGQGDFHHVLLGGRNSLENGLSALGGLSQAVADGALAVAHNDQSGELHDAAALDGLGHAVQRDELLHELAGFSLKSSHCRFLLP